MKEYIIGAFVVFLGVFAGFYASKQIPQNLAGQGGLNANSCTMLSVASVAIGNQSATEILASKPNRAWARIQNIRNATNTPALSFENTATLTTGIRLGSELTTTTPAYFELGLNTDFPYTGSTSAITDNGSTTVNIVDCLYD